MSILDIAVCVCAAFRWDLDFRICLHPKSESTRIGWPKAA